MATDRRSGVQVSPEFTVLSLPSKSVKNVVRTGYTVTVKVNSGERIQIKTNLDGYYPEEKTYDIDNSFESEGRNIVFDLDPQPAANVSFTVRDKINGKKLAAKATFTIDGTVVKSVESNERGDFENIILTQPGDYTIRVAAGDYEIQEKTEKITVNDPPEKFSLDISMGKSQQVFVIKTVDARLMKPLTGVNLKVANVQGKAMYNGTTAANVTNIDIEKETELVIEASLPGFGAFTKKVNVSDQSFTVALMPLSTVAVQVVNEKNNEQLIASVVIATPSGKQINLKTTLQGTVDFTPDVKGVYTFEVKSAGFETQLGTLEVGQVTGENYPLTIQLQPSLREVTIKVIDPAAVLVNNATVTIVNQRDENQPLFFNKQSNSWLLKIKDGETYMFQADAEGYVAANGTIKVGTEATEVLLTLTKEVLATIRAVDKYTEKPVKSTISYDGMAAAQKNQPAFEHTVILSASKQIKPLIQATGYEDYQADVINSPTTSTVLMLANEYPVTLSFASNATGEKIVPEKVQVTAVASGTVMERTGTNVYNLNAEKKYKVRASMPKFKDQEMIFEPADFLSKNNSVLKIDLIKDDTITQEFTIISSSSDEVTFLPTVNVSYADGRKLPFKKEGERYVVTSDGPYTVTASAGGYETYSKVYEKAEAGVVAIKLKKIVVNEVTFEAFDDILQRPVPAKFTLITDDKMTDLATFDEGVRAKTAVAKDEKFTIRISAPDYQDKEQSFVMNNPSDVQKIGFTRNLYPVKLIVEPRNPNFVLSTVRIKINGDGQKISTNYQPNLNTFNGEFKPGVPYSITVEADGFKPVTELVKLSDVIKRDLTKRFLLEEVELIQPKIVTDVVVEPTRKPDSALVVQPVKVATVYDQNKENLAAIPSGSAAMLTTLSSKEAIGKRYILTKVYFNQSTATMKPESDVQLAELLKVLRTNEKLKIELVGHTDNVGDSRQNMYLSKFRAKVISSYLYNNNISDERIIVKGMGDSFPVEPNVGEENMAKNRRVELIVIEN